MKKKRIDSTSSRLPFSNTGQKEKSVGLVKKNVLTYGLVRKEILYTVIFFPNEIYLLSKQLGETAY